MIRRSGAAVLAAVAALALVAPLVVWRTESPDLLVGGDARHARLEAVVQAAKRVRREVEAREAQLNAESAAARRPSPSGAARPQALKSADELYREAHELEVQAREQYYAAEESYFKANQVTHPPPPPAPPASRGGGGGGGVPLAAPGGATPGQASEPAEWRARCAAGAGGVVRGLAERTSAVGALLLRRARGRRRAHHAAVPTAAHLLQGAAPDGAPPAAPPRPRRPPAAAGRDARGAGPARYWWTGCRSSPPSRARAARARARSSTRGSARARSTRAPPASTAPHLPPAPPWGADARGGGRLVLRASPGGE